jgi:hypothetical protein
VRLLWWSAYGLPESVGNPDDIYPEHGNSSGCTSGVQKTLLKTYPGMEEELKTTSGQIPGRNQQRNGCKDEVRSRKEQERMSEIGPEEV